MSNPISQANDSLSLAKPMSVSLSPKHFVPIYEQPYKAKPMSLSISPQTFCPIYGQPY